MKILNSFIIIVSLSIVMISCHKATIPGTKISDDPDNRAILQMLENYRLALEAKDADKIIAMCSSEYFEDMGTPDPSDDYGYKELSSKLINDSFNHTDELYISFTIDNLQKTQQKAIIDVRFDYRAHLQFKAGNKWISDTEFNRIELAKQDGKWKFMTGL